MDWTTQLQVGRVWGSLENTLHLPWVQVHSSKINFKFLVRLPFLCWRHAQYHNWDSNIGVNTRITWELSKKKAHALALFYESRPLFSWLAFQVIQKIFNICEPLCIDHKLQQPWLKLTFWCQALLEQCSGVHSGCLTAMTLTSVPGLLQHQRLWLEWFQQRLMLDQ